MSSVPGQPHLLGDLAEGRLDPVAPLGEDLPQDRRHGVALPGGGGHVAPGADNPRISFMNILARWPGPGLGRGVLG